jgi:DNA mismatch repair ATPase MutL
MFDTGKGHTIPRAGLVISELANDVKELIENANGR